MARDEVGFFVSVASHGGLAANCRYPDCDWWEWYEDLVDLQVMYKDTKEHRKAVHDK